MGGGPWETRARLRLRDSNDTMAPSSGFARGKPLLLPAAGEMSNIKPNPNIVTLLCEGDLFIYFYFFN